MRVAALFDIHGNLPALEAVLEEMREAQVDRVVVGGDVVLGPMPRETLMRLLNFGLPTQFIRGNCESSVLATMTGIESNSTSERYRAIDRWTAQQLQPEYTQLFVDWPLTLRLTIDGLGEVMFCHATPRDNNEIFTRLTPEDRLLPIFAGLNVNVVVCGHTHMQFDRLIGTVRVVNAGSVGSPFGKTGADWLLLGPDIVFRNTRYDLAKAADLVRNTDYPEAQEFAMESILQPLSEEARLERITPYELNH